MARHPAASWRPALAAVALRLVPSMTHAAGPGSRAAGSPPGGVYTAAEAAGSRAQYPASREGSPFRSPITRAATMLVLGLPT
jgi:hypothetical protein